MKSYNRVIAVFGLLIIVFFLVINLSFPALSGNGEKLYLVEISRVERQISETGKIPDISGYDTIKGIYEQTGGKEFFVSSNNYAIREINGKLYRIEYAEQTDNSYMIFINTAAGIFCGAVLVLLIYIRQNIIKPFSEISEMPYELAKGDLTVPLKEQKSAYFGKFLWGLDMLREKLESSKKAELELQREKKTMLMSLSHDIKTPLSAIKLYAKAMSKGIYTEPEKLKEAAERINSNADDIERLISEIMKSGTEDIMRFDVVNSEFYLSEVIGKIVSYYTDKLLGTDFIVGKYDDCMIGGDPDRLSEVLQNIIENAVKYGDGRRIGLSFSHEEDCRLITVRNSGCTLTDSELPHIFDSFWRGSNAGSNPGSGLGLYICRRLMSAMNGDIFAEISGGDMCITVVCRKK